MDHRNGAPNGARRPAAPCLPGETGGHGANGAPRPGPNRPGANGAAMAHSIISAPEIVARLEDAGSTLLALPATGYSTRLRTTRLDIVHAAVEAYGWTHARGEPARLRPPAPTGEAIARMDQAYAWLALIPQDRYVLRRIAGARSLISPATERHLFPWRRLATLLGADHKAIQRWHGQAIALIRAGLAKE